MHDESHIVPYKVFAAVLVALLMFTGITVWISGFDMGAWNVWIALFIASCKSSLVLLYFMHLKHEKWNLKLMFLVTVFILAIFIGFTFFDILFRGN